MMRLRLIILPAAKFMLLPAFFMPKIWSAVEIDCALCTVYGQYVSEGTVRQCLKMGVQMKSEMIGWQSSVSDDLVQTVDEKIVKDSASQFHNVYVNFHIFHALFSMR
jgi:hypothetical protein